MAKKTPPRTKREIKAALSASNAASVEVTASNCSTQITLEEVMNYQIYGYGKSGQSYVAGTDSDFASAEDAAKNVTGRTADGKVFNLKDANSLIERSKNAGLATNARNEYFIGTRPSSAVTASSVLNFVYSQNGGQAAYIPQLVHGSQGLEAGQQYVFYIPSNITGSGGSNMPPAHSRSFEVTIAGAVGAGESIRIYTASIDGTAVQTGSAFTYSGSFCDSPNYQVQTVRIATASLAGGNPATSKSGILIVYTSSYADHPVSNPNASNTPYAGVTVSINPSALIHSRNE